MVSTEQNLPEQSDSALISRMAAGDERALGEFYDRHGQLAYGLALAITKCEEVAEHVVADAFSELWNDARAFRLVPTAVRGAVAGVVRRRALAVFMSDRRTDIAERSLERIIDREPTPRARTSAPIGNEQSQDAVLGVLATLPAAQRRVLELAYFGGLAVRDIALATDETEEQVHAHLRLAMETLRRSLSPLLASSPHSAIVHA